jgi:uncharacterized protein YjcR
MTESEKLVLGRRVLIAQMLVAGHTQAEIREKLHVSPNTFISTRKWLDKQIPNYKEALSDLEKAGGKKKAGGFGYGNPLSFGGLKKKNPAHFLLFNLSDSLFKKK